MEFPINDSIFPFWEIEGQEAQVPNNTSSMKMFGWRLLWQWGGVNARTPSPLKAGCAQPSAKRGEDVSGWGSCDRFCG